MDTKNIHYIHAKLVILTIFGILLYFAWCGIAMAEYVQTFTISAYYSPIPGQEKYVTGSYEGDIRLNGSGVNSADGTPVYPGMIAAPPKYPFGTKMNIPGVGIVAVHDRGGAIVAAGERGYSYDRLDVWMGYGDAGLARALNWGKRDVNVTVYGMNPELKENVYLEGFTKAEKFIKNIVTKQKVFKNDLWYGQSGDKVKELQEYLTNLGYYKGKIDGFYGDNVYKAVMKFQIDEKIVDNEEEFGAGYFGPQTRSKIEAVIEKRRKEHLPRFNLGRDDTGDEVKKLQKALKELGYDVEVTGVYDEKTIDAVFEFQRDNDIVDYIDDLGAGYYGPKTFEILSQKLNEMQNIALNVEEDSVVQAEFDAFEGDLALGDTGSEVKKLQKELRNLNLFKTEITGYYGPVTQHAVFKFQQRKGIINNANDSGAGTFGPSTRNTLNNLLGYRANTRALIAAKTASYNEESSMVAQKPDEETVIETESAKEIKNKIFTETLNYGTQHELVTKLQNTLKNLGYFTGAITTDYYGDITKDAVIAFQMDNKIIVSEKDPGAGVLGPKTRDALNSLL
jgi:peptidoglycan hydrolase-like protein with peptidoglycan-binding domain/3D (Asp-Asp-Asp) domain-containing protein